MSHWLLKTEPGDYSWDDLVHDRKAVWDGVSNALALKHIRTMNKGDLASSTTPAASAKLSDRGNHGKTVSRPEPSRRKARGR